MLRHGLSAGTEGLPSVRWTPDQRLKMVASKLPVVVPWVIISSCMHGEEWCGLSFSSERTRDATRRK